jgi:hypothetical protein
MAFRGSADLDGCFTALCLHLLEPVTCPGQGVKDGICVVFAGSLLAGLRVVDARLLSWTSPTFSLAQGRSEKCLRCGM